MVFLNAMFIGSTYLQTCKADVQDWEILGKGKYGISSGFPFASDPGLEHLSLEEILQQTRGGTVVRSTGEMTQEYQED